MSILHYVHDLSNTQLDQLHKNILYEQGTSNAQWEKQTFKKIFDLSSWGSKKEKDEFLRTFKRLDLIAFLEKEIGSDDVMKKIIEDVLPPDAPDENKKKKASKKSDQDGGKGNENMELNESSEDSNQMDSFKNN